MDTPRDNPNIPRLIGWLYLVYFSGFGIYQPYLNLYFSRIGLSSPEIGILSSLRPLTAIVAPPLFGALADSLGQRSRLLAATLWASLPAFVCLLLSRDFPAALASYALFALCVAPVIPLLDTAASEIAKHRYGRLRRWGSAGYLLAVVATGQLGQRWPLATLLGTAMLFTATAAILAGRLPAPGGANAARDSAPGSGSPPSTVARSLRALYGIPAAWRAVWAVRPLRPVFVAGFLAALAQVPHYTFFSIYADQLGMPEGMIGFAWGVGVIAEILVMSASSRWNTRLGPRVLFCVGIAGAAVRWAGMAAFTRPWIVVGLQVLHGLTFGALQVGAVTFIHARIPDQLRASGQALWAALGAGAASMLGAFAAGALYDAIGPRALYGGAAVLAAAALATATLWQPRPRPSLSPTHVAARESSHV
ncbi:MAG TPA: MFS transporter [Limnochordia bacterium]